VPQEGSLGYSAPREFHVLDEIVNLESENLKFQDMMGHRQSPNGSPNGNV
jgi:hypothetical protein